MTERMTAAEFNALAQKKGGTKRVQGAEAQTVDGVRFDSKREARRYQELRLLEQAGKIADLQRQIPIVLRGLDDVIRTPTGLPMKYIADFVYREDGERIIEDAKGHRTEVYAIKKAILAAQGVEIRET